MTLTTINLAALGDTINLTTEVTGTLPTANGGTNSTATTFVNAASNVTGTLATANGGTGTTSYAPGKLKQMEYAQYDSNTSITSVASQTATYLTDQITPSASSSYIEVTMDLTYQIYSADTDGRYQANWRIFRSINGGAYSGVYPENNNTNIAYGYDEQDNVYFQNHLNIVFIDAPSTTDTVDYKLYVTLDEGDSIDVGQNVYSQVILKEFLA